MPKAQRSIFFENALGLYECPTHEGHIIGPALETVPCFVLAHVIGRVYQDHVHGSAFNGRKQLEAVATVVASGLQRGKIIVVPEPGRLMTLMIHEPPPPIFRKPWRPDSTSFAVGAGTPDPK